MNTPKADPPSYPESKRNTADEKTPHWVKVFAIIVVLLIMLFVILHLTGNSFFHH